MKATPEERGSVARPAWSNCLPAASVATPGGCSTGSDSDAFNSAFLPMALATHYLLMSVAIMQLVATLEPVVTESDQVVLVCACRRFCFLFFGLCVNLLVSPPRTMPVTFDQAKVALVGVHGSGKMPDLSVRSYHPSFHPHRNSCNTTTLRAFVLHSEVKLQALPFTLRR